MDPSESPNPDFVPLSLYVHVPFCTTTCDFCAFVQTKPNSKDIKNYLDGIEREWLEWTGRGISNIDTVFWGGGTPGLLSSSSIKKLGDILHRNDKLSKVREWTVEMAPATVSIARLKALKEIGINRISMGVQSFNSRVLEAMSREHSTEQVFRAYEWIREQDFSSVNIDMMFAFPGQKKAELESDLLQACELEPDHLSTYCLTFEEDTALYTKLREGKFKRDIDLEAELYEFSWAFLEERGFRQYEISNFAKPGHKSAHNINTWNMYNWIGLGPSAASQFGNRRWSNPDNTSDWISSKNKDCDSNGTELSPSMLFADSIIFGLRKNEGVRLGKLEKRFNTKVSQELNGFLSELESNRLAVFGRDQSISLTLKGRLIADAIGAKILEMLA